VIQELQGLASGARSAEARSSFSMLAGLFVALDCRRSSLASWENAESAPRRQ
jgi:hypothetical protein